MRVAEGARATRAGAAAATHAARGATGQQPARAALPQEHLVVRLRQSGRRLVLPAVLFVALCYGLGWSWRPGQPLWQHVLEGVGAGLVLLLGCLVPLLRWLHRTVLVTDRRIVRRGLGRPREIVLLPGTQVETRRGPLQLMTGSGDVVVRTAAGAVRLRDLPNARLVQAALAELVERLG